MLKKKKAHKIVNWFWCEELLNKTRDLSSNPLKEELQLKHEQTYH